MQLQAPCAGRRVQAATESLSVPATCCLQEDEEEWDEEEEEDDNEEEEEEASSDDEERHVLWEPSLATPTRGLKSRRLPGAGGARGAATGAAGSGEVPQQRRRRSSTASGGSGALLPEEQPVLAHLNDHLRRQGKEAISRPTVRCWARVASASAVCTCHLELPSPRKNPVPCLPPTDCADEGGASGQADWRAALAAGQQEAGGPDSGLPPHAGAQGRGRAGPRGAGFSRRTAAAGARRGRQRQRERRGAACLLPPDGAHGQQPGPRG